MLRSRLLVAVLSPLVLLGMLELALRLAGFRHDPVDVPVAIWDLEHDKLMREGEGLFASHPPQLWTLRPGAEIPWGEDEVVNARGWRGPLRDLAKPAGVLRIVALGDSSTFGMGVPESAAYPARLEAELNAAGVPAEVLNGGVIGFTIRQGIARYTEQFRPYRPDVVVAAFGAVNEHHGCLDLPDAQKIEREVEKASGPWRLQRTLRESVRVLHLLSWVRLELSGGRKALTDRWVAEKTTELELNRSAGQRDWTGRRRVSPGDMRAALAELRELVEGDGARLILLSMPRHPQGEARSPILATYTEVLADFARESGVELVDAHGAFAAHLRAGGAPGGMFLDYWHPTEAGHRRIAQALAERIAP